ncbi:MAG: hypothetical protein U1F43_00250 [Myxococcota bacterium]
MLNATGVIVHLNLGQALPADALHAAAGQLRQRSIRPRGRRARQPPRVVEPLLLNELFEAPTTAPR